MVTGYCEPSDLDNVGIFAPALSAMSLASKQQTIKSEAELMDSYFRSRYNLPNDQPGYLAFLAWGDDVRACNAVLAATKLLAQRGYNPAAGADEIVLIMRNEKLAWLKGVSRQEIQANLTPKQHESPGYNQPNVSTHEPRGW